MSPKRRALVAYGTKHGSTRDEFKDLRDWGEIRAWARKIAKS